MLKNKKLLVILGPTASGKSSIAEKLARKFNGELINADSRQVYKGMDIGTNKSQAHLINIVEPSQEFSLANYKKLALACIQDIHKKNKLPILIGGTGLYIQAIIDNLEIPKIKPNKILRAKLENKSCEDLFNMLKKLDLQASEAIDSKNKRRLIRAIEVCLSGQKFSQKLKGKKLFNSLQIGISVPREKLIKKINARVDNMIEQGLEQEVKSLGKNIPETIGYQEFYQEKNLSKIINLIKLHTRQYAKRQLTWFKRDKRIKWVENYEEARKLVKKFL